MADTKEIAHPTKLLTVAGRVVPVPAGVTVNRDMLKAMIFGYEIAKLEGLSKEVQVGPNPATMPLLSVTTPRRVVSLMRA